jgi:hypothetical protein
LISFIRHLLIVVSKFSDHWVAIIMTFMLTNVPHQVAVSTWIFVAEIFQIYRFEHFHSCGNACCKKSGPGTEMLRSYDRKARGTWNYVSSEHGICLWMINDGSEMGELFEPSAMNHLQIRRTWGVLFIYTEVTLCSRHFHEEQLYSPLGQLRSKNHFERSPEITVMISDYIPRYM